MAKQKLSLPFVSSEKNTLMIWENNVLTEDITLDTDAWFEWLMEARPFRMVCFVKGQEVSFNVRPEQRSGGRIYWQGWKSVGGKPTKKYIGPARKVTHSKLIEAGTWFQEQIASRKNQSQELVLTIHSLCLIIDDLLVHCKDTDLTEQARADIADARDLIRSIR